MSKQKRPGTTNPVRRLRKVVEKFEPEHILGNKEADPDKKTGSKFGKRKRGKKDPRPKLHRGHSQKKHKKHKKHKTEGVDMDSIIDTVQYILENHGKNVRKVMSGYENKELLIKMAKKCMSTCLGGWQNTEKGLVSENTDLVLSKKSWEITEDGSARLIDGFQFDYDWLYNLSNASLITEDIDETEIDRDAFADTLSNASNLLRKLNDKEVKKYILNAAKEDQDIDLTNLKEILEDSGVKFKFIGAEVSGEKINLLIRVRYTKDGTQAGVVEKKLSIEVKPSADVVDTTGSEPAIDRENVDLSFPSEEGIGEEEMGEEGIDEEQPIASRIPEREPELAPEELDEEPDAGLDLEVTL